MSSTATYTLQHDTKNDVHFVNTSVSWSVKRWSGKKNSTYSGQKSGTIYTQSKFKQWLKKNELDINEIDIALLPRNI
jgi:hypothetical protein